MSFLDTQHSIDMSDSIEKLELVSATELLPEKIYHIVVDKDVLTNDVVARLVNTLKQLNVKAFISHGEVNVEELADMFSKLPNEKKLLLKAALNLTPRLPQVAEPVVFES